MGIYIEVYTSYRSREGGVRGAGSTGSGTCVVRRCSRMPRLGKGRRE